MQLGCTSVFFSNKKDPEGSFKFGDGEIRTLGTGYPIQHLSRVPP